jgi:hypothetical protein
MLLLIGGKNSILHLFFLLNSFFFDEMLNSLAIRKKIILAERIEDFREQTDIGELVCKLWFIKKNRIKLNFD